MSGLLIPVDFSENSKNAFEYALGIQKIIGGDIFVLHSYIIPYTMGMETPAAVYYTEMSGVMEEKAKNEMKDFLGSYTEQDISNVKTIINEGDLYGAIDDACKNNNLDLIVMGTQGASGLKEVFLGSNTAKIIEEVGINVLAVPESAKFNSLHSITYATNFDVNDISVIDDLLEFADSFEGKVSCVHVSTDKYDAVVDEYFMEELEDTFTEEQKLNHKTKPAFYLVRSKSAEDGILKFLEKHPTDIIATYPQDYSLLESIFHSSLTKKLAYHSNIPLLVIKKENKES